LSHVFVCFHGAVGVRDVRPVDHSIDYRLETTVGETREREVGKRGGEILLVDQRSVSQRAGNDLPASSKEMPDVEMLDAAPSHRCKDHDAAIHGEGGDVVVEVRPSNEIDDGIHALS